MAMIALATAAGMLVGAMLSSNGTKTPDQEDPRPQIGEGRIQGSQNGSQISILYGQQTIAGNVIWAGELVEITHTSEQDVGGKGGGGGDTVTRTWYSYRGSFAIGLCEGQLAAGALKKIWANDELIVDTSATTTGLEDGKIVFFDGSETQLPSSVIESAEGVGNVPAFRGLVYVVFEDFDLEPYGNQYPQLHFELEGF